MSGMIDSHSMWGSRSVHPTQFPSGVAHAADSHLLDMRLSSSVCVSLLGLALFTLCTAIDFSVCTFEDDLCGWTTTEGRQGFRWHRDTKWLSFDHTFRSQFGHYAYIWFSNTSDSTSKWSQFQSVQLTPSDNVCALRFAYVHHQHGTLTVEMNGNLLKTLRATKDKWVVEVVSLDIALPVLIQFVMKSNTSDSVVAALDDIQFIPCTWCTFEFGTCQWISASVESNNRMTNWTHRSPAALSQSKGPISDTTLHSKHGHYMYVEGSSSTLKTAMLRGQEILYNDNICSMSFWYFVSEKFNGNVTMNTVSSDGNVTLLRDKFSKDRWMWIELVVFSWVKEMRENNITMRVEFSVDIGYGSFIALDDLRYHWCADADECTFAQDTCFWNNKPSSQLQWQVKPLSNTPFNNALVANIPDSLTASLAKEGVNLEGPIVYASEHFCALRISYSFALSQSMLTVFVHHAHGTVEHEAPLQSKQSLRKSSIEIPVSVAPSSYVTLQFNEIGSFVIHSLQYLRCHYSSFEKSSSYWHDVSPSPVSSNWSLIHITNDNMVMPSVDHTYGEQQQGTYFLAMGASGFYAVATTRDAVPWSNVCGLRLRYFVSKGVAQLRFNLYNKSAAHIATYERVSRVTERWTLAEMAVGFDLFGSRIKVEASSDSSSFAVAIDDVEFTECADFFSCSFERNLCLWHTANDLSTAATWIRWRGPPPIVNATLQSDHTRGTPLGHYLLMIPVYNSSSSLSNVTAVLQGLPLSTESHVCGIEFAYHVTAAASVALTVSVESESDQQIIWGYDSSNDGNMTWTSTKANFVLHDVSHVQFMASSSDYRRTTIALDDVRYMECEEESGSGSGSRTHGATPSESSSLISSPIATSVADYPTLVTTHHTTPVILKTSTATRPTSQQSTSQTPITSRGKGRGSTRQQSTSQISITSRGKGHGPTARSAGGGKKSSDMSTTPIIGGAVGGVVVVLVIIIVVITLCRQHKNKKPSLQDQSAIFQNPTYNSTDLPQSTSRDALVQDSNSPYAEIGEMPNNCGMSMNPLYGHQRRHDKREYSTIDETVRNSTARQSENILYDSSDNTQHQQESKSSENILYDSSDHTQHQQESKSSENILYDSSDHTQHQQESKSSENVLYESADEHFRGEESESNDDDACDDSRLGIAESSINEA